MTAASPIANHNSDAWRKPHGRRLVWHEDLEAGSGRGCIAAGPASATHARLNLQTVGDGGDRYVIALKPSAHRAWLATIVEHLEPVTLASGDIVRAYRITARARATPRRSGRRLSEMSPHPSGGRAALGQRVRAIGNRQYVREVLRRGLRRDGDVWRRSCCNTNTKSEKISRRTRKYLTASFGNRLL